MPDKFFILRVDKNSCHVFVLTSSVIGKCFTWTRPRKPSKISDWESDINTTCLFSIRAWTCCYKALQINRSHIDASCICDQPAKSCPSLSSDIEISIWGKLPGDKLGNDTPEFISVSVTFCILAHSYSYIQKLNAAHFSFFWTSSFFFFSVSVKSTQWPRAFLSACVRRWLRRTVKSWPISACLSPSLLTLLFFPFLFLFPVLSQMTRTRNITLGTRAKVYGDS